MKKINELTEQEILDLTDEQVEKMVKLYWAEEGVKMLKEPEKPKYHEVPKEDLTRYMSNVFNCTFADFEEAKKAHDFIKELKSLKNYSYLLHGKVERGFTQGDIETIGVYSSELHANVEPLKKANAELKASYENALSEYNSEKERQDELSSRIWDRVNEVRDEYSHMENMYDIYKEYLELAGGESMAMAFLKKAYTVNMKTEQYIEKKMEINRFKKEYESQSLKNKSNESR
jgi:hypothetical protein